MKKTRTGPFFVIGKKGRKRATKLVREKRSVRNTMTR